MKWTSEHVENAKNFSRALEKEGFDFFTGVPCSLLGALIERLSKNGYVSAPREDAAIGMASGAYLAGKRPAVLMQNSGLGYSLNVLTSLNLIYKIPVLCLVTYRGLGPDAPEHLVMGKSCEALLREVGIRFLVPDKAELPAALAAASRAIDETKEPFAIFVKKGIFGA
jgi:sulfopyruvate decarboxylase alpha subunit